MWFLWPLLLIAVAIFSVFRGGLSLKIGEILKFSEPTPGVRRFAEAKRVGRYSYYAYLVPRPRDLYLLDNVKGEDVSGILKKEGCEAGINGGFYDEDFAPLGLIIKEGQVLSPQKRSLLLDGYFALSDNNEVEIGPTTPLANSRLAIQSGPLLLDQGGTLELQIKDDKFSRRSVLANLNGRALFFVSIFDAQSVFSGPKLNELPSLLLEIARDNKWQIQSALNLDGGSSSFFYNDNVVLGEYRAVRTILCVKN